MIKASKPYLLPQVDKGKAELYEKFKKMLIIYSSKVAFDDLFNEEGIKELYM